MRAMTGTDSNSGGNNGSPRVDQARKIVAKRRSDSRSRGGGGDEQRAASTTTANDYSLNPFQCLDASAGAGAGASGVKMVRGSYSPNKSRGGGNYNRSRSTDRSRGPPAIQYADSMTSEATPVHANNHYQNTVNAQYGNDNRYNDSDDSGSYNGGSARGNNYNEYNESGVEYAADHYDVDNDNDNDGNDGNANARERNVMHSLLPNHSLVDDSSTFADETTTAPGSPRSHGKTGSNGHANGGIGGTSRSSHSNNSGSGGNNTGSGTNSGSGSGSKEAYTRIMHQYLVQSQTNPLTKRAAASVIVEAATASTGVNTTSTTTKTTKTTTRTITTTNAGHRGQDRPSPSPPRPPLPPLDPSSSQNPTNSRLRSLLSSGLASASNANNNRSTSKDKDHKDGGGDDATTEDMTNSYPISNDGASTISSLSSGSGRRAAYRSLVHFLPSLLPMPPPPPPQSTPPMQQHSNQVAATGNSLHDLNVSGISYQSSQTGGTARRSLNGSGDGTHSDGNRPTPVRSRSRPRDQVGVDPDGPLMGRRATVRGGDEEDTSNNGNAKGVTSRRPQYNNHHRYDDSDDSETLGSLVTAEGEDGDNHTHADSAAAGFYPVGQMQQQQQRAHQRQSQVQKRSDDSVGSNNVARDILSKYGQGKSSGNNGTRPTERSSSDHPPVDASPPPRPSPNGTRHSASLRMKARSRSPANRRSHPQSNPTTSKSESPLAESEQNQGTDTDPVPASSDAPSSANNNPSDRRNGGKQGSIAARIAMFEKNNAGTPPSTPPKPRTTTKRWTPPNDIPNPTVQPGAPSPTSKEAMSSSIDGDESMAGASVISRASSIPFDEKIDRGMRAAASTLSRTAPIPEQKELAHDDDEWRERMIKGQRQVTPKGTTASSGNSDLPEPSDPSRSVSPRKPNWQSAGTSPPARSPPTTPSAQENLSEAQPQDAVVTNEQVSQNRGARAARLARHRQRSLSPQKAEIPAQAEEPPSDTPTHEDQFTGPTTKSIFSPPVSGNRVRYVMCWNFVSLFHIQLSLFSLRTNLATSFISLLPLPAVGAYRLKMLRKVALMILMK